MANADPNPRAANDPLVATQQITSTPTVDGSQVAPQTLYPPQGPDPTGTMPGAVSQMESSEKASPQGGGPGIEGEEVVWEARYSMKNFLGRIAVRGLLTIGWIALAIYTWGYEHTQMVPVTAILGIVVLILWLALGFRIAQARFGHYYKLTDRRLFVSTGLMHRRRDQMELLRVKDVFTRQSLVERWLSLGTVIVVSDEKELPTFYIAGVDEPKRVMDMVWHYARAERDNRSTKIDSV